MKSSAIIEVLPRMIERRRPVMIWGSPGAGKSDVVRQVGERMGRQVIDFRLAMRDPTALMGFPMPDAKTKTMKFFRDNQLPTEGTGILFMDEINSAPQATQAAGMQLTLDGRIGDYILPDGWAVVAAGNRETDRAVVHRMPSALSLRFRHIDYTVTEEDWVDWALKNGIHTDVISFIRFRPALLDKFDPQARSSPNPRGWAFVNEEYNQHNAADEYDVIAGIVGEGASAEFKGFVDQIKHLPSREQILLAPDKTEIPDSPATLFALTTSLGASVDPNCMDRMMVYVERMPVEFQVLFARDAIRKDQNVCNEQSFVKWSLKNSKVMA